MPQKKINGSISAKMSKEPRSKSEVPSGSILQHPVPEFLQKGRKNPINGMNCFFSEATFCKIVGPEPSFHERFMIQLSRAKGACSGNPDEKKKRRKDLDLPDQKVTGLKASNIDSKLTSERQVHFPQNVAESESSDGNESSTDLVIADDDNEEEEEEGVVNSSSSSKVSVSPSEEILSGEKDGQNEAGPTTGLDEPQKSEASAESSGHDEKTIPLYAAGIRFQGNVSLTTKSKMDTDSLEEAHMTKQTKNVGRREEALVMNQINNVEGRKMNSSAGCQDSVPCEAQREASKVRESSLPLIPALMSEPAEAKKAVKSHNPVNLLKPTMTSLFYTSNEPKPFSSSEFVTNSLNPDLDASQIAVTTENAMSIADVDVPIFSLAGSSDGVDAAAGMKRSLRNKGIWSAGQEANQNMSSKSQKLKKDNSVKDIIKFRQSSLTRNQMATYLELFEKYARPYLHGGQHPVFTEKQKREMADFESLRGRVLNEQREFQSYLQQNAVKNPQFYFFIRGTAKHYAYTKVQSYRPPKNLVSKFSLKFTSEVPLCAGPGRTELTFQQHLLEMGSAPKITLPEIKSDGKLSQIPHNMNKIEENFPSSPSRNLKDRDILHHQSVSEDVNAETLAVKYGSDAVMSSSVIKCLLENRAPGFKRRWNIPVVVKEHKVQDGVRKVVYLDKPVFEENLIMRDCNALFHKYALRTMVSQCRHLPAYRSLRQQTHLGSKSGKKNKPEVKAADDPFDMFATNLEDLETFGKVSDVGRKEESGEPSKTEELKTGETKCRRSKRIEESHSEKDKVSQAETLAVSESSPKKSVEKHTKEIDSSTSLQADPDQQQGRRRKLSLSSTFSHEGSNDKTILSPAKKFREEATPAETSVTQNLSINSEQSSAKSARPKRRVTSLLPQVGTATKQPPSSVGGDDQSDNGNLLDLILGPSVDAPLKKDVTSQTREKASEYTPHSEALSGLVYNLWELGSTNIIIRTRSQGILNNKNVYLTAKMEYQVTHGVEQVTAEELIRDWTACYIRPNTKLLRARVNAYTSEILMFEELECHQILTPTSTFRPQEGFSFMDNLITHLSSLDVGNYLVSHEPGMNFCGIRTLKHGARLKNIEKPLPAPPETKKLSSESVPWIPIDPNILLPYHTLHQRIPATFLPRDLVVVPGSKKPQKPKNVANLAIKKKKKKSKFQKKNKEREFF